MSTFTLQRAPDAPGWSIAGTLTIYTAAEAHGALREALGALAPAEGPGEDDGAPLPLHAEGLEEADGAAVQLLVATAHSLRRAGRRPCLASASPALLAVAQALGALAADRCCGWHWQAA